MGTRNNRAEESADVQEVRMTANYNAELQLSAFVAAL